MFKINNYFTSINFKSHSIRNKNIDGQISLFPQSDEFVSSDKTDKQRVRSAEMSESIEEDNLKRNEHPSEPFDADKMSSEDLKQFIQFKFEKLDEEGHLPEKKRLLKELCAIDSPLVGDGLKTMYSKTKRDNKLKLYLLDALVTRKYPDLKGKSILLATSSNDNERNQVLNELVSDNRPGINFVLTEVLDMMSGSDKFGIDILDGMSQRLNPGYKGYCKRLVSPDKSLFEKEKFIKILNADKRPQAEVIQIYLLKFLRSCPDIRPNDSAKSNSKSTGSIQLRIEIMKNLQNKLIIDTNPEKIKFRNKKINDALLNEFKIGINPTVVRLWAFNVLTRRPDPDKYVYNSVKNYVYALEHSTSKGYEDSFGMKLGLATAKNFLENKE